MSAQTAILIIASGVFLMFALIIWSGVQTKRRIGNKSIEELFQAASELQRKAEAAWQLPPELAVPPPRIVRSAPILIRLALASPLLLFLATAAAAIYSLWFIHLYQPPVHSWPQISVFLYHRFLDFLRAPAWHAWMVWPTALFLGIACFVGLPGPFRRRREKRLLKWGLPARAVMISSQGSIGHYRYEDESGDTITSTANSTRPWKNPLCGTVVYNPENPREFILYPAYRYRIKGHDSR
jgi:hypothetical protein